MSDDVARPCDLAGVTLVVLAGGLGRRMGFPKAHLQIQGKPILLWLLDQLRWPGPTMLVTAPAVPDAPGAGRFDQHLMDPCDGLGPLQGILTALQGLPTSLAAVVTVDMPLIKLTMLDWLIEALRSRPSINGVLCHVFAAEQDRIEPFPCALRRSAAPIIAQRMDQDRRSVRDLRNEPSFAVIQTPANWPANAWTNLNHPAQLKEFLNVIPATDTPSQK